MSGRLLFIVVGVIVASVSCEPINFRALVAEPPPLPQKIALAGGGLALAKRVARGRPPPLRSVIGGREEATLVAEAPPRGLALFARAITLLLIFLPVFAASHGSIPLC